MKKTLQSLFAKVGYEVHRINTAGMDPIEATDADQRIWDTVRPFTMTSRLRVHSLVSAVRYVVENDIRGDFVECGVWKGGSAMAMALALKEMQVTDRRIWLYDTFEGMTEPTDQDVDMDGLAASLQMKQHGELDGHSAWCFSPLDEVTANIELTGYPLEQFEFVRGDVLTTLESSSPTNIAVLRLDTDWYESTAAELRMLYPKLASGGVCLIDDFGHWAGARRAIVEYFEEHGPKPLIHRIDYTGRIFVKV